MFRLTCTHFVALLLQIVAFRWLPTAYLAVWLQGAGGDPAERQSLDIVDIQSSRYVLSREAAGDREGFNIIILVNNQCHYLRFSH